MSQKVQKNVRRLYAQQVLSGFKYLNQPKNEDSDSSQNEQRGEEKLSPEFWQQKEYQISISLIIETIGFGSDEYKYQICINDDSDILITPAGKRGKKIPQQVATIHKETITKNRKIPMVYGIQPQGFRSLSYISGFSIGQGITEFYSFLLGQLDRTIEHIIQQQKNAKGDDDTRERAESTQPQEGLGTTKKPGRGGKIRDEVRAKAISEASAIMDTAYREVLGRRSGNDGDKLVGVGDDTDIGNALEGLSLDF